LSLVVYRGMDMLARVYTSEHNPIISSEL
jgi:hypothetical protein